MFHISFYNIWVSINIYIWRQKSYNMDKQFLCLDSPTDFMVGKYISADELKEFINIPCKIKAGVFILCMEGQIRSTINMSELTTSKLNVVTLLPNSRIQIHEISPDILIYFIAFSFDFMCYTNFIKSTMGYLLMIYRYPIIKISQNRPTWSRTSTSFSINMPYIPISWTIKRW